MPEYHFRFEFTVCCNIGSLLEYLRRKVKREARKSTNKKFTMFHSTRIIQAAGERSRSVLGVLRHCDMSSGHVHQAVLDSAERS